MKKKLLITLSVVACALLLVVGSIAGTIAYLTSQSEVVTNTFSVGNVTITLNETKVDAYGKAIDGADRVTENSYKLIPGHTYIKDPTIHVAAGSEECYLFVKVVNGLVAVEGADTIASQLQGNGWKQLTGVENVWYYDGTISTNAVAAIDDIDVPTFEAFTLDESANVESVKNESITIKAYAIQVDGFDSAVEASAKLDFTA